MLATGLGPCTKHFKSNYQSLQCSVHVIRIKGCFTKIVNPTNYLTAVHCTDWLEKYKKKLPGLYFSINPICSAVSGGGVQHHPLHHQNHC